MTSFSGALDTRRCDGSIAQSTTVEWVDCAIDPLADEDSSQIARRSPYCETIRAVRAGSFPGARFWPAWIGPRIRTGASTEFIVTYVAPVPLVNHDHNALSGIVL